MSSHILPKCCEKKEPEDEQLCIAAHITNNICEVDPLDNSSNKAQLSEHCLT